jgi:hypothetical protein
LKLSDDVIEDKFTSTPDSRIWDFSPRGFSPKKPGLFPYGADRRFKFHKCGQLFIRYTQPKSRLHTLVWVHRLQMCERTKTDRMLVWFVTIVIALVTGALIFACE